MDYERPATMRAPGSAERDRPDSAGAAPNGGDHGNVALVADLVAATALVPPAQFAKVRERAGSNGSFAEALIDEGVATGDGVARALAEHYHLPHVDLAATSVDQVAVDAIPLRVLERVVAIPFATEEGRLKVAVADPGNVLALDELRLATRKPVDLYVGAREDILNEIRRLSRASQAFGAILTDEAFPDADEEAADLEADDGVSEAPLVRLVNSIIFEGAEDGASDIHLDPQEDALVVRYRVDGVLREAHTVPKRMLPGVVARVKVLAKLDIAERRKPQDGRISLNAVAAGRLLDIRVATLPTVEGEAVTMRLLDKSKKPPSFEDLGLLEEMRAQLMRIVRRPTGALLVTGPTGSGKSTTLYAGLNSINRPDINIITVEDPVEYRLAGVNQVQINVKAGLTFATILRSILRSDPDVVMVGEIRDPETAKISIEAALTGHLVLSTLHTNDAPGALTRLNEMGVEPFLTGSAVSAVLAQRLARKLCRHCVEMYMPSEEELIKSRIAPEMAAALDGIAFGRKKGCPRCSNTGYRGRIGVYQLLTMSEQLEELASSKASRDELERAAISEGMRTLWDDGVAKVAAGLTTIEELARVTV
jgi:type IV pilus assembly protein PilB